jgi:benzylsuccinate synthase
MAETLKLTHRSADIRLEPGTAKPCLKCKWGIEDPTDPSKGQCIGSRTKMGSIWKRLIKDYYNMTCDKFEEGEVYFRDHV